MDIKYNDKLMQYWGNYDLNIVYAGDARLGADWHSQDASAPFSRIYYIAGGEGSIAMESEKIQMTAGNLYIIPAGIKFEYHCETYMHQIFFHVNVMDSSGLDILQGCSKICRRNVSEEKIQQIQQLYHSDRIGDAFRLKGILWGEIAEMLEESNAWQQGIRKYSDLVEDFFRLAQNPVNVKNSVSHLAKQLCVSVSTLGKRFRQETAMTPRSYLQQLVISQACYLLAVDEGRIADVADKLGFDDQLYFTKFFRLHMHITPSEYRKIMRAG